MNYYAVEYTYGRACDDRGRYCGTIRRFSSRLRRDAWVSEGTGEYASSPGSREAITRKSMYPDELRAALAEEVQ